MPVRMKPVYKAKRKRPTRSEMDDRGKRALAYLDEYLEGNEEEPVQFLTRFWEDQAAALGYTDLIALARNEEKAGEIFSNWYQQYSVLIGGRMAQLWEQSMEAAARTHLDLMGTGFVFNAAEERVLDWMHERAGNLITAVTQEQVEAVRYILLEGRANRMGSEELARYIRPIVGLTRPQAGANLRLYVSVRDRLREQHPRMTDESIGKKAREAAARYAARQQRYRAQTIARTEMAFSYNEGMYQATKQAMEQGLLPVMQKIWRTANTGRVCEACEALEGTVVGMDSDFVTQRGKNIVREMTALYPPMHPRCQCCVEYVEVLVDGKPVWNQEEVPEGSRPETDLPETAEEQGAAAGVQEEPGAKERTQDYLDNLTESRLNIPRNHRAKEIIASTEDYVGEQLGISREEAHARLKEGLEAIVDNGEFAIRISPESLEASLADGRFKNTYESGGGTFSNDPIGTKERKRQERLLFGVPEKDTDGLTAADRPVYGMLMPAYDETDASVVDYYLQGPGIYYGDITVVLDKNSVINNTSLTLGDSFDYSWGLVGTEANDPSYSGSCYGKEGALTIANLSGAGKNEVSSALISLTANGDRRVDRYVELQFHGEETHSVANIARVFIPEKTVQDGKTNTLIDILDQNGITYRVVKAKDAEQSIESKEYIHLLEKLGEDAPKTFDEFQKIKYDNGELWKFMQLDLNRRNDLMEHPFLALPNAGNTEIDDRKFSEFIFNKSNPHDWAKGTAFESRLGYTSDNWQLLKSEIKKRASFYPASDKGTTSYGHKYQQRLVVYGLKGTPANVEVGWMVSNDNQTVMTSAYINEVGKDEFEF